MTAKPILIFQAPFSMIHLAENEASTMKEQLGDKFHIMTLLSAKADRIKVSTITDTFTKEEFKEYVEELFCILKPKL